MNEADCAKNQSECRKEMFSAMLPRWAAVILIGFFIAIMGTCFTLSMLARAEAGEATKTAACQSRDIEHITATLCRLEANQEKTVALLMELRAEKK